MTTPPNDRIMKEIEDLVRLESERALGVFRGRDFASGLAARLKAGEVPSREPHFLRRLLAPALGFVLLAAAGLALFLLRSPGPSKAGLSVLHAVIEIYGRPGSGDAPSGKIPRTGDRETRVDDDWIIGRVLALLVPEHAEGESCLSSRTADGPAARFNRRERVRILFQDRAIERVFMKIHIFDKEA